MSKLFSHKASHKGFTLIELLVVIAIIGMLSSIVFASLNSARVKGRIASMQGSMRSAQTTALLCMDDGKDLGPANGAFFAGANICATATNAPGTFATLPSSSWSYSMIERTSSDGTFSFSATGDSKTITCTEAGCQ